MNILLSGGTGFIGRLLTRTLLLQGHAVSLLSRRPLPADFPTAAQTIPWEGRATPQLIEKIARADAVVNLAGASIGERRWTVDRKREIEESRLATTKVIVDAIALSPRRPAVLLSASAVGYYGDAGSDAVTELHPPGNGFLAGLCVRWEAAAREVERLGVRVVFPRMGVVLAPDGGALARMAAPFRLFAGGPLGSGKQWFPWVHSEDVVHAISYALTADALSGPFNLVAPEPVTMEQFARHLGNALHRPSWIRVPGPLLSFALGEMAEMILHGARVIPEVLIHSGFSFRYPTLAGAFAEIFQKNS